MHCELFCLWNGFVASLRRVRTAIKVSPLVVSKLDQRKNISHNNHGMESSLAYTWVDPACSIAGRLSFPQILLVAKNMLLRSCLPSRPGDDGQYWIFFGVKRKTGRRASDLMGFGNLCRPITKQETHECTERWKRSVAP